MHAPDDLVTVAAARGVRDPRVLEALRRVPRSLFVPPGARFVRLTGRWGFAP